MFFLSVNDNGIFDSNGLWALIGALLGFVFSILLAFIQKKCAISRLIKRLKLEINTVVIPSIKEDIKNNDPDPTLFNSPIWDFVSQTSALLDVNEKLYIWIANIYVAIERYLRTATDGNDYSVGERLNHREALLMAFRNNPIDKAWVNL